MEAAFEWQNSNNFETRSKEISRDLFAMYLFIPHKTACALATKIWSMLTRRCYFNDVL